MRRPTAEPSKSHAGRLCGMSVAGENHPLHPGLLRSCEPRIADAFPPSNINPLEGNSLKNGPNGDGQNYPSLSSDCTWLRSTDHVQNHQRRHLGKPVFGASFKGGTSPPTYRSPPPKKGAGRKLAQRAAARSKVSPSFSKRIQ